MTLLLGVTVLDKSDLPKEGGISGRTGFTLIEILVVLAISAVLTALIIPNLPGILGAQNVTSEAYDLSDLLGRARSYALANNTYVWVGFFEEDGTQPSQVPAVSGTGRDGTRYNEAAITSTLPAAFGAADPSNLVSLAQVRKLFRLNNVHLVANNAGHMPVRPSVPVSYQVGDPAGQPPNNTSGPFAVHAGAESGNPTTFTYPLRASGAPPAQYTFAKIMEFNPQGEASKIDENVLSGPGPQSAMEIAIQPTHGGAVSLTFSGAKAAVAIQVQGLTGQVRIYRL
jgi:prepilin-type N-terminal cleavage/methylation domain-containing protein